MEWIIVLRWAGAEVHVYASIEKYVDYLRTVAGSGDQECTCDKIGVALRENPANEI